MKIKLKDLLLLGNAFTNTKREMLLSLTIVLIVTFVLSAIFYVVESVAQPDLFQNYTDALVWAYTRYIEGGDGVFDGGPITIIGKFIAALLGIVSIAIVAIPAGLMGSGFIDAMEEEKRKTANARNADRIIRSMHTHCSLLKGVRFWPRKWYRFTEILTNLDINQNDIISAVRSCPNLRLRDLSTWLTTTGGIKPEMMAVEICYNNCSYGYTSLQEPENKTAKNKSNVTIVASTATAEAGLGYFAYHLARIGGFNVVINEQLSSNADKDENRCIVSGIRDSQYNDKENYPKLHQFVDDIKTCVSYKDSWVILLKTAKTPGEEAKKHQKIRIVLEVDDAEKENTISDCTGCDDHDRLQVFYDDMCTTMKSEHDIEPYIEYRNGKKTALRNYIRNRFDSHPNVIEIDLADDYRLFGTDVKAQWTSIYTLACLIHTHFDENNKESTCTEWTKEDVKAHRLDMIPKHKDE